MDAVLAAEAFHRVLLENNLVRVLDTRIEPGETVPMHAHEWPMVGYLIAWSDFVRRDEHGTITADSRQSDQKPAPGSAMWLPPMGPHTLENVGDGTLHMVTVEIKPAG